jgi:hypothetical protein
MILLLLCGAISLLHDGEDSKHRNHPALDQGTAAEIF